MKKEAEILRLYALPRGALVDGSMHTIAPQTGVHHSTSGEQAQVDWARFGSVTIPLPIGAFTKLLRF